MLSFQMIKTFRDNCDINIVQQTSCELPFPDFSNAVKNVLFRSFCTSMYASQLWCDFRKAYIRRLRVAYNFGCRALYTFRGKRVLVVIKFNVIFVHLRPYCEKMCTCFLKDGKSPAIQGCVLWCSQIVYIRPSLNTTTPNYFVAEGRDIPYRVARWKFQ